MPLVSIGLPVYNGENYLREAAQSILSQTFEDFELIVCDNASSDGTEAICAELASADARIRYVRHAENLGAAPNFNKCVDLATGVYFKWAAHDDICRPEYLRHCVEQLEADPGVSLCQTGVQFIDDAGDVISDYDQEEIMFEAKGRMAQFARAISEAHYCVAVFGLMRLDLLRQTTLIASHVGSDRSLISQMALRGRLVEAPGRLFLSRDHSDRSVRAMELADRESWFDTRNPVSAKRYYLRMLRAHIAALSNASLSAGEWLQAGRILLLWVWRYKRKLLRDLVSS